MKRIEKSLINISLVCFSLIFVFLISEVTIRTYDFFSQGIAFFDPEEPYYSEFGWPGDKIFGNKNSKKIKVFFIGDSFTTGIGVEERYKYYNLIKNNLDVEIFVYAACGYGTLQEYMVIDKYFDEIKPDLVVLQVCFNDFIDNSWHLGRACFSQDSSLIRPYLIGEEIEFRFVRPFGELKILLFRSRLFTKLDYPLSKLLAYLTVKGSPHSVEKDIHDKGLDFEGFREAVTTTDTLIANIKNRIGKTPIIAFNVFDIPIYPKLFKEIFEKNDIVFIEGVSRKIRQQETEGIKVRIEDGHFSEIGHRICSQVLTEAIKKLMAVNKQEL